MRTTRTPQTKTYAIAQDASSRLRLTISLLAALTITLIPVTMLTVEALK